MFFILSPLDFEKYKLDKLCISHGLKALEMRADHMEAVVGAAFDVLHV
jgi:hypothetical protein